MSGATRNRIARLDADDSLDSFNSSPNGAVNAIAIQQPDGKIVVGGEYQPFVLSAVLARYNESAQGR